jgi:DNA-directed RNA polymerase subunit RPC12/RpoP
MASSIRYVCGTCGRTVEAWSDGNPYYIDERGEKRYAYHPNHDALARCVGNDTPHLCLRCGEEFNVDSRAPSGGCPRCTTREIAPTYELDGRACPSCDAGRFAADPRGFAIS